MHHLDRDAHRALERASRTVPQWRIGAHALARSPQRHRTPPPTISAWRRLLRRLGVG